MNYEEMRKKAKKQGNATSVAPAFFKWVEPKQYIVGKFLKRTMVEDPDPKKRYFQYLFDTDSGPVKCHMGSNYDSEAGGLLEVGEIYDISYRGKESLGANRSVNLFQTLRIPSEKSPDELAMDEAFHTDAEGADDAALDEK